MSTKIKHLESSIEHRESSFLVLTSNFLLLCSPSSVPAPLHLSREIYKSTLFMQNEPNFKNDQIDISAYNTSGYGNFLTFFHPKNEAKRTQNEPNFSSKLASFFPILALLFNSDDYKRLAMNIIVSVASISKSSSSVDKYRRLLNPSTMLRKIKSETAKEQKEG